MYFKNVKFKNIEETIETFKRPDLAYISDLCYLDRNASKAGILIGDVEYPIDWGLLEEKEIHTGLLIRFDIGELDLVPSREAIRYTENTKKKLKQKLVDIKKDFNIYIRQELSKEQDFVKYVSAIHDIRRATEHRYYGFNFKEIIIYL